MPLSDDNSGSAKIRVKSDPAQLYLHGVWVLRQEFHLQEQFVNLVQCTCRTLMGGQVEGRFSVVG